MRPRRPGWREGPRIYNAPRRVSIHAPGGNRTPDLRLRRPTLYPSELRARVERNGVSEGARTLNPRIHSPVLYQLSYAHRVPLILARPEGIEPPTRGLEGR